MSPRDRNPASLAATAANVFKRSRVDRASRSRRVTISTSPFAHPAKDLAQSRSVLSRPTRRLTKYLLGSGHAQLLHLRVRALAVRRYSRIAVNHRSIMHQIYATKSPFGSKQSFWCKTISARQRQQRAESGSWSTAGTGGITVSSGRRGHCQSVVADRIFRLSSFAAAPVTNPPSMTNSEPEMKLDSSDARNGASFATSSASPALPIGVRSIKAF